MKEKKVSKKVNKKKKNKHIKAIKEREKQILSNADWETYVDELMDTHPNYMALLTAMLHNMTPDKALHHAGVRTLDKTPGESRISKNSYVSGKKRGIQREDKYRVLNV